MDIKDLNNENNVNNENNAEETQFCKEKFKENVKEYLDIDDQIKALNKAVKARRDKKKKLSEYILKLMKQFEIDNMNTSNGKLIYSVSKSKEPLSKKNLLTTLNLYYNNNDKATEVSKYIMENRPVKERVTLRRKIIKKPKI